MVRDITLILLSVILITAGCQEPVGNSIRDKNHYQQILQNTKTQPSFNLPVHKYQSSNILITTKVLNAELFDYDALEVLWRYVDTDTTSASRPSIFYDSGFKTGAADEFFDAQLELLKSRMNSVTVKEYEVTVKKGSFSYVDIGKAISIPMFYYKGQLYSRIDYEFGLTGKSLKIEASVPDNDKIRLTFTPIFKDILNIEGDLKMSDLSASVDIKPGQSIVIGGKQNANPNVSDAFLNNEINSKPSKYLIIITADYQ